MTENAVETRDLADETVGMDKYEAFLVELKGSENMTLAVIVGIFASIAGVCLWAAVTVTTGYQIGWMAIGVGFLVGILIRALGRGVSIRFGLIGAAFSFLGCALGNFLSIVGFISIQENMEFLDVLLQLDYAVVSEIMMATFSIMDLLFYGLAIYTGYRLSFRQIKDEELEGLATA